MTSAAKHDAALEAQSSGSDPPIELIGTRGSAAAYAIRDFLYRSDVPFRWLN